MAAADKTYLQELSREVLKELSDRELAMSFVLAQAPKTVKVNSGGWAIQVGRLRGLQSSIEIWLDQFTGYDERKIYYCVYSEQPIKISHIVKLVSPYLEDHINISTSDWSETSQVVQLIEPLSKNHFGRPVFEKYPEHKEYMFGIYEYEKPWQGSNKAKTLIERINEFVATICNLLTEEKINQNTKNFRALENIKVFRSVIQSQRNAYLMALRKQHDNYICQVCGFNFKASYGQLGMNYAEAHHKKPLGKNQKKQYTKIEDLITVCANCHSMLNRMEGEANDVVKLKAIVKRNRGKSNP